MSHRAGVFLVAAVISIGLLQSPAEVHAAAGSLRTCPYLMRQLTAVSARSVSCKRADAVARAYVLGYHHPMAFRCRQVPVYQHGIETNWYGVCRKGKAVVRLVPE